MRPSCVHLARSLEKEGRSLIFKRTAFALPRGGLQIRLRPFFSYRNSASRLLTVKKHQ